MSAYRLVSYLGGIGRALSARDYRIYWYSHVFSSHGVWMHRMAVGVLIYHLTGSPAWLGFIGFVYSLPLMLFGPVAGAIADRVGIRRTAILAIVTSVTLTSAMGALTLSRLMTPALVASFVVALGCVQAFDFPVRQVLIQLLVGRERMPAAVALNSTTFYTASFTGPMICAVVLSVARGYVGETAPGVVFVIYGLTMAALMSAILRTRMRDKPFERHRTTKLLGDVREGLTYTLTHEGMRFTIMMAFCLSMLIRPYVDLMPGYAVAVFHRGTDGVGTMIAASGMGALCCSVVMALRGRTEGLTRILNVGAVAATSALLLFSAVTGFWLAAVMMAMVGGGLVVSSIAAQSLVQHATENEFRARVISVYFALVVGAQSIGVLVMGWVAELGGFRLAYGAAAAVALTGAVVMGPRLWRSAPKLEAPRIG